MSFSVYVVELDISRKSVYVGSTAHAPSSRMLRHLQGRKASRYVREHGAAHLKGLDHERMNERLLYSLGPTPAWAKGAEFRYITKNGR